MTTQLISITHDVSLPLVIYQDQPVVTFAMIDKAHSKAEGQSKFTSILKVKAPAFQAGRFHLQP